MKFRRTPAFERWFKGSKVVTESGDPLVVYHGTATAFTRFGTGRGAIYFTSDPHIASLYADSADATDEDGEPITHLVEPAPNVIPAVLRMKKPLILDEAWACENLGPAGDDRDWVDFDSIIWEAQDEGKFDGVILRGVFDFAGFTAKKKRIVKAYDQYIVFDPTQIKSAIGNSGRYELNSPSIADHPDEEDLQIEVVRERMAA